MTLFLILVAAFNVGFLAGTWWGSGWRRRERARLDLELLRLRRELAEKQSQATILLFEPPSSKQTG